MSPSHTRTKQSRAKSAQRQRLETESAPISTTLEFSDEAKGTAAERLQLFPTAFYAATILELRQRRGTSQFSANSAAAVTSGHLVGQMYR